MTHTAGKLFFLLFGRGHRDLLLAHDVRFVTGWALLGFAAGIHFFATFLTGKHGHGSNLQYDLLWTAEGGCPTWEFVKFSGALAPPAFLLPLPPDIMPEFLKVVRVNA
jgi:hypothetical protein